MLKILQAKLQQYMNQELQMYKLDLEKAEVIIYSETDHQPRLDAWDKCSDLVHWEDPEGWCREGGGRGDRDGEHM